MGQRLGQHFLASQPILQAIAEAALSGAPKCIVEVGPGKGALTEHLLATGAEVIAIELDQAMISALERRFPSHPRLRIVPADILDIDLTQYGATALAGNLPYYITSPIIERITAARAQIQTAVLLVQLEVAQRLCAKPGSRSFSYLTVATQTYAEASLLCTVPPEAFRPPPKVESAVVRLVLRQAADRAEEFLRFASAAFRHKRKTLRNNLRADYGEAWIGGRPEANLRAEQLSIEDLRKLFESQP